MLWRLVPCINQHEWPSSWVARFHLRAPALCKRRLKGTLDHARGCRVYRGRSCRVSHHGLEQTAQKTRGRGIRWLRAAVPALGASQLHCIDDGVVHTTLIHRALCLGDVPPIVVGLAFRGGSCRVPSRERERERERLVVHAERSGREREREQQSQQIAGCGGTLAHHGGVAHAAFIQQR